MAKKKRQPPKKTPKRPHRPKSHPEATPSLPDRRVLEGLMQKFVRDVGEPVEETPLSRAQAVVYQAVEIQDSQKRLELAKQALAISPDCADAYVLLAEAASSRKEALELYRKAVEAGERALGPEVFEEAVGDFWGLLETRPYMRAKLGLADTLWTSGRRVEAVEQLQDMLRLNPDDNQGVRYTLASWLLLRTTTTTWSGCSSSIPTRVRPPGPTPRRCSPSAGEETRPRPRRCSRRPGRSTSTSPTTCRARSRCLASSPTSTALVTRARRSSTWAAPWAPGRPRLG